MSSSGWDYVRDSWRACQHCLTVRPVCEMVRDDSDPVGLSRFICRDRVWCLEQVKRAQDSATVLQ